mmetsp:Transcript_87514/g.173682  ORF Transcript_87514/g.173682 Transcript_87514/m.173682 type:complete len:364 (-) Transcript_87514:25-1116(-)
MLRLALVLAVVDGVVTAKTAGRVADTCYHSLVQNRHLVGTWIDQSRGDAHVCSLPVCVFHGSNAPRVWVAQHVDGAGHRMQNIINGMAVAQKVGMNFGGVSWEDEATDQGINFTDVAIDFFGANPRDVGGLFLGAAKSNPGFDFSFRDSKELEGQREKINDGTKVWMAVAHEWYWNYSVPSSFFFPAEFRRKLAAPLASWPLLFTPSKTVVAMHLRRGDLRPGDFRATPNKYYYQIADRIRELLPSAEFHVWAAIKNERGGAYYKNEDFDGFRERDMQVHLDDGFEDEKSLVRTWAHLAFANIFVGSQSSFSYVPMVLNCRCVISMIDNPGLDNWMNGKDEKRDSYQTELEACVQRSQAQNDC